MIFLDLGELLYVAERAIGCAPEVRDYGLLESALARPQATAFGSDAYESIHEKVSAFTHSLARNHALVDGNKRLALAGLIAFLGVNGYRLVWSNDQAYEFIMVLACGELDDIQTMADMLSKATELR